MKKTIQLLCVTFLFLTAQHAYSQVGLAIGIKGGPNFANISTDASASTNYKNRTGFHAGAFFLIKAAKFGIQPEVIFSQQGSTVKVNTQKFDANYSYLNIPIIVKLYLAAGLNLQAGPQFGFVTSAKNKTTFNGVTTTQDVKDQINKSDMSLGLGLGWDLPFGLTIDGRYNLGLSKINKSSSSTSSNAKNQVIQLSLGYKLFKFGE
jgi:hypothetical protein